MLTLRTFGGLSIENAMLVGGSAARRRPLALLALLAVDGRRGLSRDKVLALLWPDSDAERARNSLSQALSAIRRELGADDVVIGSTELRLNPDVLTSDVGEYEQHLDAGEFEEAVVLYVAPFLDGVFIKGAPEFERWIDQERLRLAHLQSEALQALALGADARGDRRTAVKWWRRVAALEPTLTIGALGLMEALAAVGDSPAALQHYRIYETLLRDEFGLSPDESVSALAERLRTFSSHGIARVDGESHHVVESLHPAKGESFVEPNHVAPRRRPRPSIRNAAAAIIAGTVIGAALVSLHTIDQPRIASRNVAVVRFDNLTGDSTLNGIGVTAADFIVDGLARSGLPVETKPELRAIPLARAGGIPADEASAGRGGLVVTGHYSRAGDGLMIVANVATESGFLVATIEPVRAATAAPDSALRNMSQRILGLLAVQLTDTLAELLPPPSTSTPTLPAYREFVEGLGLAQHESWGTAVRRFDRAYQLDSTFLPALVWQVFAFRNLGNRVSADSIVRVMARHRTRMSALDRLLLEQFEAGDDRLAAITALQQAVKLAPGSIWAYNLGQKLVAQGRFREAAAAFEQIDRRHGWIRNWPRFWRGFADALSGFDDERQLEIAREGRRTLPSDMDLIFVEARALAALGRSAEFERALADLETSADVKRVLGRELWILSKTFRRRGDMRWHRRVLERAIGWYSSLPAADANSVGNRRFFSQALYDAGRYTEAEAVARRLVAEDPDDLYSLATVALCRVRLGDTRAGDAAIQTLVAKTGTRDYTENLLNAASIASVAGERDRAVRYLKEFMDRSGRELHEMPGNTDFDNLAGYGPYLALVGREGPR